jgi:acyl-CoA thioester hydrolase
VKQVLPRIDTEIIIPFHDIDPMNIVWHGRYVKYLEVARCNLLESFDYSYQQMQASGYSWPVVDMRIKYVKPVKFEQKIRIEAQLVEWEYRLKVNYRIVDANTGVKLTKAHTIQVAVDLETQEMCYESPPVLQQKLGL